MSRLLITPYSALDYAVRRYRPSHVLSLLVEPYVETPEGIAPGRHLRISVHDISEPALDAVAPAPDHIDQILDFSRGWDRSQPFLVHCWAGISRSTAAAYVLLCDLHGPGHEHAIAQGLRYRAPHAQPNRLLIRHADAILGREGRMIEAVEAMGDGVPAYEGEIADLPIALDEL